MIDIVVNEEWDEDDCVYQFDNLKELYDRIVMKDLICIDEDTHEEVVVTFDNIVFLEKKQFVISYDEGYFRLSDFEGFDRSFRMFEYFVNNVMESDCNDIFVC